MSTTRGWFTVSACLDGRSIEIVRKTNPELPDVWRLSRTDVDDLRALLEEAPSKHAETHEPAEPNYHARVALLEEQGRTTRAIVNKLATQMRLLELGLKVP